MTPVTFAVVDDGSHSTHAGEFHSALVAGSGRKIRVRSLTLRIVAPLGRRWDC
jgi:hypothetical protein